MRKLLMTCALAFAGHVSAIQYGILIESDTTVQWTAPKGYVQSGVNLETVLLRMNCKGTTYQDFLNCVAAQGWDLATVHTYQPNRSQSTFTMWVFKKP
jgi:hypothetical protein